MSDLISSLVLGVWTTSMAFQLCSVVYYRLKTCRRPQDRTTDYDRVLKGEVRNGWRRVLWFGYEGNVARWTYGMAFPPLRSFISADQSDEVIVIMDRYPIPNGRKVMRLRQFSMIRPSRKSTLLMVTYSPEQYVHTFSCFLTPRSIANVFRINSLDDPQQFLVLLIDEFDRRVRRLTVRIPEADLWAWFAYIDDKPNLHLVFSKTIEDEEMGRRHDIFDFKYPLDFTRQHPLAPLSWETISVPMGQRVWDFHYYVGFARCQMLCDKSDATNLDAHLCVSLDHTGHWRVESMSEWLKSLQRTSIGLKILEAMKSVDTLSPPDDWSYSYIPRVRCLDLVYPIGDRMVSISDKGAMVLQRLHSAPALKRLAIEQVFRINPDLEQPRLEATIGFKVEEVMKDDEDASMIHL